MRNIGILAVVGVLALSFAGCGGDYNPPPPIVTGPGLVGLDDTIADTAPLLTVTYTLPATPGTVTVQILSDLASDGDIAFTPPSSFTVTTGPSFVLFGIDTLNTNLPEYRAFLTFPLDGFTGQPIVPGTPLSSVPTSRCSSPCSISPRPFPPSSTWSSTRRSRPVAWPPSISTRSRWRPDRSISLLPTWDFSSRSM